MVFFSFVLFCACVKMAVCYGGVSGSPLLEPLPPELPPRAPLDESDSRLLGGGGSSLSMPFPETPDATGKCYRNTFVLLIHPLDQN